jgi:putative RNA 2'-phosphotransferase
MDDVRVSRFLSLVLRHEPEKIGLRLDPAGWAEVDALLAACARHGIELSRERLAEIVARNEKQRFGFDQSGRRIRANQGHSVPVKLDYPRVSPPEVLYHGTVRKFLPAILKEGLLKGARHHVHLSADKVTARNVGQRRGPPVILLVRSGEMHRAGHAFFPSANGVWLVDSVPPQFLNPLQQR